MRYIVLQYSAEYAAVYSAPTILYSQLKILSKLTTIDCDMVSVTTVDCDLVSVTTVIEPGRSVRYKVINYMNRCF